MLTSTLLLHITTFAGASQDSSDTAEECTGEEIEGSYFPDWPYCHQSEPLSEQCDGFTWWSSTGCPSFQDYALHAFSRELEAVIYLYQCSGVDGVEYDWVYISPFTIDTVSAEEGIFGPDGVMLSLSVSSYSLYDWVCCEGHEMRETRSYGERVLLNCYPPLHTYTIDNFLTDTSDTATSTADTAPPSETADTASPTETADTAVATTKRRCGCATGHTLGWLPLTALVVFARRRRSEKGHALWCHSKR